MWVFGYGSLIFRPGFRYVERLTGFVPHVARRFWQGSTDHRGVPGAPGRVVTLVDAPGERCWGVAYHLEGNDAARALNELDVREQGGYVRRLVDVYAGPPEQSAAPIVTGALTYLGTNQNPNYLGPASLDDVARQILRSRGPSGANLDYLLKLAASLRDLGVDDAHVFAIEDAVQRLRAERSNESRLDPAGGD